MMRSYLFVPASSERLVPKALASHADVVVLDLEDAIVDGAKEYAREILRTHERSIRERLTHVRVGTTPDGYDHRDVELAAVVGAAGIRLPKADDPDAVASVARQLDSTSSDLILHITIESALGLTRVGELARSSNRVERAVFGERDFVADLGVDGPGLLTDHARAILSISSRAAGLRAPIDGAFIGLEDEDGLRRSATTAKQLGFWGKSAIHPSQLAVIHEVFEPAPHEVEWAKRVRQAHDEAQASGSGVTVLDGVFVDAAVARRAAMLAGEDER